MRPNDGRVVSKFIIQALSNNDITIYGDGTQSRSFCYISDLVEGLILLMQSNYQGPFNLGNPDEFKIIDFAKYVIELLNSNSKLVFLPLPSDDPTKRKPDISFAKEKLGFNPRVTIQEGLKKTAEYFTELQKA